MLAVSFAGSVAAGPFEDATAAYDKGDYATVLRLMRPLAEQGNAWRKAVLASRSGAKPETDGWWASRNLAVIAAGIRSAREGRAVEVDALMAGGE